MNNDSEFTVIRYPWQILVIAFIAALAFAFTIGYFFGASGAS